MLRNAKIDYAGRTVDLLLLKTVIRPFDQRVAPVVTEVPMLVSGIEKLVQRYALLFLTELGSVMNSPDEGTEFLTYLSHGKIYDESSLKSSAARADNRASRQIKQEDSALETPDDEALASSEIMNVSFDRTRASVTVTVRITTLAGESYTYVTPISMGV